MSPKISVVIIGASAGGVSAIQNILKKLSPDFELPIIVIQHLPRDFQMIPSMIFQTGNGAKVIEALDKSPIEKKHVYLAPPDYHLLIEKNFSFSLSQDEPVHHSRPSIDVSFESASLVFQEHLCGILLTGANSDGAEGLLNIQKAGGITFVQDPAEAEATAMPQAALKKLTPSFKGKLVEISERLNQLQKGLFA